MLFDSISSSPTPDTSYIFISISIIVLLLLRLPCDKSAAEGTGGLAKRAAEEVSSLDIFSARLVDYNLA